MKFRQKLKIGIWFAISFGLPFFIWVIIWCINYPSTQFNIRGVWECIGWSLAVFTFSGVMYNFVKLLEGD
jgi:hypothetical protein